MTYSTISKLAWSANHLFMDLQSTLGSAIDEELQACGHPATPEPFFAWPKPVSEAFFNLCMDVLFAPEECSESIAKIGVGRIARMIVAHRMTEAGVAEGAISEAL